MGYVNHPTVSDKPIEELNDEEVQRELVVRVLYDAHLMTINAEEDPRNRMFSEMVIQAFAHFLGDEYDVYYDHVRDLTGYILKKEAEAKGKNLDDVFREAGISEDKINRLVGEINRSFDA